MPWPLLCYCSNVLPAWQVHGSDCDAAEVRLCQIDERSDDGVRGILEPCGSSERALVPERPSYVISPPYRLIDQAWMRYRCTGAGERRAAASNRLARPRAVQS